MPRSAFPFVGAHAGESFYQIPRHKETRMLTTFITPFGRYAFCRLFFGIRTAPEENGRDMIDEAGIRADLSKVTKCDNA